MPFFDTVVLRDRHTRLLITPAATTAAQRQLLTDCGFVPSPNGKKEERAARRRARDFGRETKADERYSKEERRMDRMARRMRRQTRKNEKAIKRTGRPAIVAGGVASGDGQLLHCVEFQSEDALGLGLEGILPDPGPGEHRQREDSGNVTVVRVELGGQADQLSVSVGMVLVSVAGVNVVDPETALPRSVGEVHAMVNAARQATPKLMLEFAYPLPPAPEDTVMQLDPLEPMGLELTDTVRPGDEATPWKVRCVSVVPGSQSADYGLQVPCVLTAVGGRSIADRGFDYVLSVLELAKGEAAESDQTLELQFQAIPDRTQWVSEPDVGASAAPGGAMDVVTRHVFANGEPLGIELAASESGVRAVAIHAGGQGDLLGVPEGRMLATVQDETVLGLSFEEAVGKIQAAKSSKKPLVLGFQAMLPSEDPVVAALSADPSATLDLSDAGTTPVSSRIVSGFAFPMEESLGLELEEAPADEPWKVQTVGCVPKSVAERFCVAQGSLVTAVQGEPCEGLTWQEVIGKISSAKGGGDALFGIDGVVCIQFTSPLGEPPPLRVREVDSDTDDLGEVPGWLRSVGMKRHRKVFEENAIDDMELLEELGEAQLKEMGLGAVERRLLLRAIGDWSQMGREEAKKAAAAAAEAKILQLHRENADLRAKLSTADSKAEWAEEQATQMAQMAQMRAEQQSQSATFDGDSDGGVTRAKLKAKRSSRRKQAEAKPAVRAPRMDGSRRKDELMDALDAQERELAAVAAAAPPSADSKPARRPKGSSGRKTKAEKVVAEPEVDDSWMDDPLSEPEYADSEYADSEDAYALPRPSNAKVAEKNKKKQKSKKDKSTEEPKAASKYRLKQHTSAFAVRQPSPQPPPTSRSLAIDTALLTLHMTLSAGWWRL